MVYCKIREDSEHNVASETVQAAPWIGWMQQLVPFSPSVCVAGSVGTWLAEYGIHGTRPLWHPSDIDVFVMVPTVREYEAVCDAFVDSFATTFALTTAATTLRTSVEKRKYPHILIVRWWVIWNGVEVACPEFSLIHSPSKLRSDVLMEQFDIDICKVSVHVEHGRLYYCTNSIVYSHIRQRHMHCVLTQDPSFHYPMQKTLSRISKYAARGFAFKSLTFAPTFSTLQVADFERVCR